VEKGSAAAAAAAAAALFSLVALLSPKASNGLPLPALPRLVLPGHSLVVPVAGMALPGAKGPIFFPPTVRGLFPVLFPVGQGLVFSWFRLDVPTKRHLHRKLNPL